VRHGRERSQEKSAVEPDPGQGGRPSVWRLSFPPVALDKGAPSLLEWGPRLGHAGICPLDDSVTKTGLVGKALHEALSDSSREIQAVRLNKGTFS